jgi:hypothetical protein
MSAALPLALCAIFVFLALWHVQMAFANRMGTSGGVPEVDGKPLFVPSRRSTLLVALMLLAFAALIAANAGLLALGVPAKFLSWMSYALAAGLFARAIGEFRYVGFFKRVKGSRFAKLDSLVYSPLCLVLAIGVAAVAWRHGGS